MAEILLVRHAQSYANKQDFTAFGNVESPLTERGIEQAVALNGVFRAEFGIVPEEYDRPVVASAYTRPQQTAQHAGFQHIDINPLINESVIDSRLESGKDIVKRHSLERWVPESVRQRASDFVDQVHSGELNYEIYFSHGVFIAAVLLECDVRLIEVAVPFTEDRGYVPLQAAVTKLDI
ncbi:hypothetical protein BH09PAT3_BH09PAT3_4020 [soil metagenome]